MYTRVYLRCIPLYMSPCVPYGGIPYMPPCVPYGGIPPYMPPYYLGVHPSAQRRRPWAHRASQDRHILDLSGLIFPVILRYSRF